MIWTEERKNLARACCRKWEGVPHANRIAVHGVGIDCVKFLNEVLVDSGIVERAEFGGYDINEGLHGKSDTMIKVVTRALHAVPVEIESAEFGDIAVFKNGINAGHCAFVDVPNIWHALARQRVVRTKLSLWKPEIETIYRLTEIGWKMNPQMAINL